MKKLYERQQRTIARPVELYGVGFLTGQTVHLRFRPAPACTGIVFVRTDLGPGACITAHVDQVSGTQRRTTLGRGLLSVGLVEHVLASLAGLHIDNCYLELDAPEPPGLDGSARQFVESLSAAGVRSLTARRTVWAVTEPIVVRQGDSTLALYPPEPHKAYDNAQQSPLRISYFLDYGPKAPIHRQLRTQTVTPTSFASDIAYCRTFLLEEEAIAFKQQGLGARTKMSDLLVFGPKGPIDNRLRYADEPARHKILDIIGDLSLLGHDIAGHVVAHRSGHPLNVDLARQLQTRIAESAARNDGRRAA